MLTRASTFLSYFRWLYMPAGLFALVAVGLHAAADTLDDRILWVVDHLDASLDGVLAQWGPTQSWVHLIEPRHATLIARGVALCWELGAALVIALPKLGYREEAVQAKARFVVLVSKPRTWKELFVKTWRQPTLMRLSHPLFTAALCVAGACAIASMVQGALFLSLRQGVLSDDVAGPVARLCALLCLAGVLLTFGWRAVLRSLQYADRVSEEEAKTVRRKVTVGLWGFAVVAPLAWVAALDASPLLSFFR